MKYILSVFVSGILFIIGMNIGYKMCKVEKPPERVYLENVQNVEYLISSWDGKVTLLKINGIYPKNQQVYDVVYNWFENDPKMFYDLEKDKPQFAQGLKTYWGLKDFEIHLHKLEDNKK